MNKEFFERKANIVAKELLGKILVRALPDRELKARIVEIEAYFDENDPASRACQNGDLRVTMMMKAGTILIYGVHNNWLMNFVTGEEGKAEAVLIRAIEPLNFEGNTSGPGLLTKALRIGKEFHKRNILNDKEIWIENIEYIGDMKNKIFIDKEDKINNLVIAKSFRIGVKKDLPIKLRFHIRGNRFVSRR